MKRSFGALVMFVSLVGSVGCKKAAEKEQKPPAKTEVKDVGSAPGSAGSATGSGSAAAAPDPWTKTAPKKDPVAAPMFWKAEKDGKTTYFLGTMHMGVEAEEKLPKIVWDKLDAAKTFAMEADLSDPKLGGALMRAKGTLREELGADYWKKLESVVGADLAANMDRLTSMGAAAMMALKDLPKTSPMDGVLLGRAQNQNKKLVYLEEGKLQVDVLTKHMGIKALKMMIDTAEEGAAASKAMLDAYVAGDAEGIIKVTDSQKAVALKHGYSEKEYAEQMEDILYKRNASWIPALEKMHAAGGDPFVAVGAMHLIGPRSVLEMLEKKGYKVERIKP
jgi:uncharacterized protein